MEIREWGHSVVVTDDCLKIRMNTRERRKAEKERNERNVDGPGRSTII